MANRIKLGVLNLMHDKLDTQQRFAHVLPDADLTFFYPRMHYQNRPVPPEVAKISQPLDLNHIQDFDGFIITGAPLDHLDFEQVTYIEEVRCLLQLLDKYKLQQLYFCWGAMVALDYFYDIQKRILAEKIFGTFPHLIIEPNSLLNGLSQGFIAPHARYAEMDKAQTMQDPRLTINSVDDNDHLFMVSSLTKPEQNFVFSHIEYDREGLKKEYEREIAAHPERHYKRPENYSLSAPLFQWKDTQKIFFDNWLTQVKKSKLVLDK